MGVISLSRALRLVAAPRTVEAPRVMAVAMEATEDFIVRVSVKKERKLV